MGRNSKYHFVQKISGQHPSKFICALIGVLMCVHISSQTTQLKFEKIEIRSSHINVHSGVEDDDGFIWFGSYDGLYRYNGSDFTIFYNDPFDSASLTHGRPLYVVKGNQNDLWIGTTTGGISRLNLNTYRFESIRHRFEDPNSLGGNEIGGLYVDTDSTIWVGSDEYCLNKITWPQQTVQRYYPDVAEADLDYRRYSRYLGLIIADKQRDDLLWIGAPFGIYSFNKNTNTFTLYRSPTNQTQYKPIPVSLYADNDGIIWAGSAEGIGRIDPGSGRVLQVPLRSESYTKETIGGWKPIAINEFSAEELIVMTHYDGLVIYNRSSGHSHLVNNDSSLGRGSNLYMRDSRGNIWIESDGTLLIHSKDFSKAGKISLAGLPGLNWSRSFLPVPGKNGLYVGTYWGAGLLYADLDTRTVSTYTYRFDFAADRDVYMYDLTWALDSVICIASDGGLLQFDRSTESIERIVDTSFRYAWDEITSVCGCGSEVWFAAPNEGLFSIVYHKAGHRPGIAIPTSLKITDLRCTADALLIGTTTGLLKMKFGSENLESIIPDIHVSELVLAGDSLWISTLGQGLFGLDLRHSDRHHQYASPLGSSVNLIYTFIRDDQGMFWLNTDGGTVHFDPRTGEYITYLEMGIGRRSPIAQMQNGQIVSGGYQALRYFNPEDLSHRGLPPRPYFTKIDIANHEEAFGLAPDRIERVVLKPSQRELTVEFDAINFNNIATTDFEYILHGWSETWKSLGKQRYLKVGNLKRGDYLLEIRATNAYGGMSEANKKLSIVVLPPVYERWWFQMLTVLALAVGVVFLIMHRRKQRERLLFKKTIEYFTKSRHAENSVDEILWDIARNVVSRLDFEDCTLYLYDKESDSLIQKASAIWKDRKNQEIRDPANIPFGKGVIGLAARNKSAVVFSESGDETHIAVPVVHDDHAIAVISCKHSRRKFISNGRTEILSQIARECAFGIASAQAAKEIERRERDLLEIQKEIAEHKLTALQAQMNPHFIFNSLNSINWYILKNKPAEASMYLTKFSKLVRRILDNSKNLSIPLQNELEVLRLYLELEGMRFENTFDYEIQTDDEIDMEEVLIPPLILQPFVENAIWHGLMHKKHKGNLLIQIYQENGHLKCIVQDDGIGRKASQRMKVENSTPYESKGMKLTTERIKLAHKDYLNENSIRVIDLVGTDGEAAGTRVEVLLPYE